MAYPMEDAETRPYDQQNGHTNLKPSYINPYKASISNPLTLHHHGQARPPLLACFSESSKGGRNFLFLADGVVSFVASL
ncbi:hypothetical protein V6N13_024875 [Hibiscus sabdariffa]|uniref:Uncharacterized protein n=1 Tax=Hibiscus sabdariffa TaxID=183260 RepID=A0ABR2QGK4_9ROSI